jgi:succinate dehydrogenase/fumarate reductase flavoprotein subunit
MIDDKARESDRARPPDVDVLVVGGGMAGLGAGELAARAGARVMVIDKAASCGGSAAISSGIFWLPPDLATYRAHVPLGDAALAAAVIGDFDDAIAAIRALEVDVTERFDGVMGFGIGHRIDMEALIASTARSIEKNGGRVLPGGAARALLGNPTRVHGAIIDLPGAGPAAITARAVILATGGFQGDRARVTACMGPSADHLLLRSNPGSVGDGLRLGLSVGAATSAAMASFYGHLMPRPIRDFGPQHYLPLTQYHSKHCVLVNRDGRRFSPEARGDEVSNQALLAEPEARGVLICDEAIRRQHVITPALPHTEAVDRFAAAVAAGARYATAPSLAALADEVAAWDIPRANLAATLATCAAPDPAALPLDAPWGDAGPRLREPPFHALEIQPSITFTFGGLRIDPNGRVLDHDGRVIAGLFAAGADAGGFSNEVYAGGLAPAFILGRRAARAALL